MTPTNYDSYTQARAHLKDMLDAADKGIPVTMRRDATRAAVVDASRLRDLLAQTSPARAEVVAEAGGWSVFVPGIPVSADGPTFDEAITEMVDALRGYVSDWQQRLLDVPNHHGSWGVVQLVSLSDDAELRDWLTGAAS